MSVDDILVQIPTAVDSYPTEKKQVKNAQAVSVIKRLIVVPPPPALRTKNATPPESQSSVAAATTSARSAVSIVKNAQVAPPANMAAAMSVSNPPAALTVPAMSNTPATTQAPAKVITVPTAEISPIPPGKAVPTVVVHEQLAESQVPPSLSNRLSVTECRMVLSLAARFGPEWFNVAPEQGLHTMIKNEFSGR